MSSIQMHAFKEVNIPKNNHIALQMLYSEMSKYRGNTETVKYSSILSDMWKPYGNTHIETNFDPSCKYNTHV